MTHSGTVLSRRQLGPVYVTEERERERGEEGEDKNSEICPSVVKNYGLIPSVTSEL